MFIGNSKNVQKKYGSARKWYRFAFVFNSFPVIITYIVGAMYQDELGILPSQIITYFSIIAIHMVYISFGLKAFIKKESKIIDAFVLGSAIYSTLTVVLYYTLMYSLMSFGTDILGRAAFIQDILVHFLMPLTLMGILLYEIGKGKRYSWLSIIPLVPFYIAYHFFMVWYSPQINNYWPYWFLDPRKLGWDEVYKRYFIVCSVSFLVASLIISWSRARNKKYDFKIWR